MGQHEGLLGWPTWIGVVVDDLEAQRTFWGEMLGVPEDHAGPGFAHFIMPTGEIFEVIERSEIPEYNGRRFQVGFEVADIEGVLERLRPHGAELVGELVRYEDSFKLCYVRGPEGIIVELAEKIG